MKVVVVLLSIVLFIYGVVAEEPLDNDKEECIKELKLNRAEMVKLDALELPPDNNEDFNKFVVCDSKKKGLMTKNGEILFDGIENLLTSAPEIKNLSKVQLVAFKKIMSTIVNACRSTPMIADPGKNIIHVYSCMYHELNNIKKSLE